MGFKDKEHASATGLSIDCLDVIRCKSDPSHQANLVCKSPKGHPTEYYLLPEIEQPVDCVFCNARGGALDACNFGKRLNKVDRLRHDPTQFTSSLNNLARGTGSVPSIPRGRKLPRLLPDKSTYNLGEFLH
jgi:hypothetical protein